MKIVLSFKYAWNGIQYCCRNELNFGIHLLSAMTIIMAGFYFSISKMEWLVITGCCMFVLVTEMINTALESLCDRITTEIDPAIKKIKDIAAGAVLLGAIGSVMAAGIIFFPKIFN